MFGGIIQISDFIFMGVLLWFIFLYIIIMIMRKFYTYSYTKLGETMREEFIKEINRLNNIIKSMGENNE